MIDEKLDQDYNKLIQKIFTLKYEQYLLESNESNSNDEFKKLLLEKETLEAKILDNDNEWKKVIKELDEYLTENFQKQNNVLNNVRIQLLKSIPVIERDLKKFKQEEQKFNSLMECKIEKYDKEQQFLIEELQKYLNVEEMTLVKEFIDNCDEYMRKKIEMIENDNKNDENNSPLSECNEQFFQNDENIENEMEKNQSTFDDNNNNDSKITTTIEMIKPKKIVKFSENLDITQQTISQQESNNDLEKLFFNYEKSFEPMNNDDEINQQMDFHLNDDEDEQNLTNTNISNMFDDNNLNNNENNKSDFEFNFSLDDN